MKFTASYAGLRALLDCFSWPRLVALSILATAAQAADAGKQPGELLAGFAQADITPAEPVVLAGSPSRLVSTAIKYRLYARALVLSDGKQKVAVVTLDTLKYPVEHSERARLQIEKSTGIPASHVIICSSHTHRGPLWSYYPDQLVTPIAEAVAKAAQALSPCRVGMVKCRAEGVSECRRVIKDGRAWNRWQLKPDERDKYPAEGPADPEFDVLALIGADQKCKAVLYNFACHAANTRDLSVSADFPGAVQQHLRDHLGYEAPALFLTGACGDVNPIYSVKEEVFGEKLGGEIVRGLGRLDFIPQPALSLEAREFQMPGRENPEFKEAEVARNWPGQLEHYRKAFADMKLRARPSYLYFITGLRIGGDFALITNANELFCGVAIDIKKRSPFKHTMTVEQTNGSHGYVPTAEAFENGSYETWFGEHSHLTVKAAGIIERESLDILQRLKNPR